MSTPHLHVAIPVLDELDYLPHTLASIAQQRSSFPFTVYLCINQPDAWWDDVEHLPICENNQATLALLREPLPFEVQVLDYSSRGRGWRGKDYGVGWARKKLFERIIERAKEKDILISMDADTTFPDDYFESIGHSFQQNPEWHAISVPYYHPLTHNDLLDRTMLRYEIYMRNYTLNMLHIQSPYAFSALGSAIAVRVSSLRKIGGITPMKSGEDFYLLQKLRKMGTVGLWNRVPVYPGTRFSQRVAFGTGPAMQKGAYGNWDSYPIYHHTLFQEIANAYTHIAQLYHEEVNNPFLHFLQEQFHDPSLWQPIRKNAQTGAQFQRAFHEKADGLRILQFLKSQQKEQSQTDATALCENLCFLFPEETLELQALFNQHCPSVCNNPYGSKDSAEAALPIPRYPSEQAKIHTPTSYSDITTRSEDTTRYPKANETLGETLQLMQMPTESLQTIRHKMFLLETQLRQKET